jgi:hypothetical protein
MPLTAADCAGLQGLRLPQPGGAVYQTRSPAKRAALAHTNLPQQLALVVGIERVHYARFLPRNQGPFAVPKVDQNR